MTNFDIMPQEHLNKCLAQKLTLCAEFTEMKKLKVYIAAPWFDNAALMIYNHVKQIDALLGNANKFNLYFPKDHNYDDPELTFNSNINAIEEADLLIALIDRKDVGTAFEIGYAYAKGKEIYLVGYDESSFTTKTNLMLAFAGKCFTLDNLPKFLTQGLDSVDFIRIGETWEGLE